MLQWVNSEFMKIEKFTWHQFKYFFYNPFQNSPTNEEDCDVSDLGNVIMKRDSQLQH